MTGYSESNGVQDLNYEAIETIFIGSKEEYEKSKKEGYLEFIPAVEPDRKKFQFTIPDGFKGWVKITSSNPDVEYSHSIEIDQNGEATIPNLDMSFERTYDQFYYKNKKDGELEQIPEEHISEIYYFPDLITIYIGPQENLEPFKYEDYIKNH